jgi:hypothetical protein
MEVVMSVVIQFFNSRGGGTSVELGAVRSPFTDEVSARRYAQQEFKQRQELPVGRRPANYRGIDEATGSQLFAGPKA